MADSPFKSVGGEAKPKIAADKVIVSQDVGELCPFVGTFPVMGPPKSIVQGGGPQMPDIQHVMMPCVQARCSQWNEDEKECGIVTQRKCSEETVDLLNDLVEGLKPLAGMFGRK